MNRWTSNLFVALGLSTPVNVKTVMDYTQHDEVLKEKK
jgi:hypothetical protein